jgi:hypothetical protein
VYILPTGKCAMNMHEKYLMGAWPGKKQEKTGLIFCGSSLATGSTDTAGYIS